LEQNNEKLHVVVMGNFPYPQGMAGTKRIQHFIDGLVVAAVYEVQVLLIRQAERSLQREQVMKNGTHQGVPFQTIGGDLKVDLLFPFRAIQFLLEGFRVLWGYKDKARKVIYYYGVLNLDNLAFILFAKWIGFKIIFDIVEDNQFEGGSVSFKRKVNLFLTKKLDLLNLKWADGIVIISKHLQNKYTALNKWNKPVVLIPISADLNVGNRKQQMNDPVRLIYAGSFSAKDGVDLLIEATKIAAQKHPLKLFLIGRGKGAASYRERYGDRPEIEFLGYLEDDVYYQQLRTGDIMCVSRVDSEFAHAGFPFKLGEYLATGNPVISSDTGDVSEYLKPNEEAILVRPGDVQALADAMSFLIENPARAFQIGQSGLAVCEASFSPKKNAGLLINLIEEFYQKK
jgi:glycosyltransferase involved in cell wall biosynthesis